MKNFPEIDAKWQEVWQEKGCFKSEINYNKPKYYVLEMFPYPSGRIHVGHLRNYSMGDLISRFYRANGFNVLYPMGWDAFGLPAENAAIQNNIHPSDWTMSNIEAMKEQIQRVGISYDWRREIATCSPDYYRHEQGFFIKLLDKGLAYQKESVVNWDPVDNTVLANEQVIDGKGWRSGALVEKRKLRQWFLKITDYAQELLEDIDNLKGWPESVRIMQQNWIGKSTGANIDFKVQDSDKILSVYSTRPDTLFGASFVAVAYDHDIVDLVKRNNEVDKFIEKCRHMSTATADIEKAEKEAVHTGIYVHHPFDENIILPVLIANYVLKDYGFGAVFGCPAHDERDFEVAKKYHLPIKQVVRAVEGETQLPYTESGILCNSSFLDNLSVEEAKAKSIEKLIELKKGSSKVNFKIKDWGVSRQRYWGCPIPVVYCQDCGVVPVKEEDLPVELPKDVDFSKTGNPLANHPSWKNTTCPKCSKPAQRETDTFDTFFESSWYFARYCNNKYDSMVDKKAADYWLSVDQYIGGVEHAVLHLLYARFFTKAMNDLEIVSIREPFKNLLTQGMVLHATYKDQDGNWVYPDEIDRSSGDLIHRTTGKKVVQGKIEKMSKSKKNVIDLDNITKSYGADTVRLFILSDSPPERDLEWSESGVEGCYKFLAKLAHYAEKISSGKYLDLELENLECKTHLTIKEVTIDIKNFHFNKAIARIRGLFNDIQDNFSSTSKTIKFAFETVVRLLNPFTPHITEEIWEILGNQEILAEYTWPTYLEDKIVAKFITLAIQVNGKLRGTIDVEPSLSKEDIEKRVMEMKEVAKYFDGVSIKKIILVPGKIINFVVG